MKAIILAAGRGSRLLGHTEEIPKALVELAGKPLLFWQLEALAQAGAGDIAVVTGYRGEKIKNLTATAPAPFTAITNPRWAESNMLASLLCAAEWAAGRDCLMSYSDIVYPPRHVQKLMQSAAPLALTYDTEWQTLWSLRQNGDILNDAESFQEENGRLTEIGAKPGSLAEVQGQYMGLLKISAKGWPLLLKECAALGRAVDKTDMTGFLSILLKGGTEIAAVPIAGAWCEVDTDEDLRRYEDAIANENFSHDWR